jgi:hypothetical protein
LRVIAASNTAASPNSSQTGPVAGFLPGVPLGCLGIVETDIASEPEPLPKLLGIRNRGRAWGEIAATPHATS